MKRWSILIALSIFGVTLSNAQITSFSDGSDGTLSVAASTVIDLSLAPTGAWDDVSTTPGFGVYDPDEWAVVFKYDSVNVSAGTLSYLNHPKNAPVVWLVENDVTIDGAVALDGGVGHDHAATHVFSEPGPGGFRGGVGSLPGVLATGSFGPGGRTQAGDSAHGQGGLYATAYGNDGIVPLIGGSGGQPGNIPNNSDTGGGGGGGGALLIIAGGTVTVNGTIRANGGNGGGSGTFGRAGGGGSGGAIRIVCDLLTGIGELQANGGARGRSGAGDGDLGKIRLEANTNTFSGTSSPPFSPGNPEVPPVLWPASTDPSITPVTLGGVAIPADPESNLQVTETDTVVINEGLAELILAAENIPTDSTVEVRLIHTAGPTQELAATFQSGDATSSTWSVMVDLTGGVSAIQARAILPPAP